MSVAAAPLAQEIMVPAESALAVSAWVRLVPAILGQVPMSAGSLVRLDQPRHRPNREAHIPMIQLLRAIGDPALPPAVPRLAYGVWSVTAATMIRGIALTSGCHGFRDHRSEFPRFGERRGLGSFARRLRWRHRGRLSSGRVPCGGCLRFRAWQQRARCRRAIPNVVGARAPDASDPAPASSVKRAAASWATEPLRLTPIVSPLKVTAAPQAPATRFGQRNSRSEMRNTSKPGAIAFPVCSCAWPNRRCHKSISASVAPRICRLDGSPSHTG